MRYKKNGRTIASGMDCTGLLIAVGRDVGVDIEDYHYSGEPSQQAMDAILATHCTLDANVRLVQGRVVQMQIPRMAGAVHTGILADIRGNLSLIHAWESQHHVLEPLLDLRWERRIVATWHLNWLKEA